MSLVRLRNVQKTYRSLQGADYVAVERFENVEFGLRMRGMGKRER